MDNTNTNFGGVNRQGRENWHTIVPSLQLNLVVKLILFITGQMQHWEFFLLMLNILLWSFWTDCDEEGTHHISIWHGYIKVIHWYYSKGGLVNTQMKWKILKTIHFRIEFEEAFNVLKENCPIVSVAEDAVCDANHNSMNGTTHHQALQLLLGGVKSWIWLLKCQYW